MNDLPWMSKEEIELLLEIITDKKVFEYGSGSSTLWLSKYAKSVISIEHDLSWFKTVESIIASCDNAKVFHVPPSESWDPSKGLDGTLTEFYNYVNYPLNVREEYDVFLVDGRARIDCCDLISKNFPNSLIAFHDFKNRLWDGVHDYGKVLENYEIAKESNTLAILKIKNVF
jgi:hypothetical protein